MDSSDRFLAAEGLGWVEAIIPPTHRCSAITYGTTAIDASSSPTLTTAVADERARRCCVRVSAYQTLVRNCVLDIETYEAAHPHPS